MAFLSDPLSLLLFAGMVVLAFFIGRFGRKAVFWWRARKAPAAPAGPPPSRQVQRAQRRRQEKRMRD